MSAVKSLKLSSLNFSRLLESQRTERVSRRWLKFSRYKVAEFKNDLLKINEDTTLQSCRNSSL